MEKIRTLLVDDHKIVRDGIKFILNSDKGIEVISEGSNGVEAIRFLEKNNDIDVILMDINMPELNGVDATEIIRKLYPKIRILALTMHTEESYILNMIKAGALGYVVKDTNADKLIYAVKTVASGKNYYSNSVTSTIVNHLIHKPNQSDKDIKPTLSTREIEVIKLVAKGLTNNKIGESLKIGSRTVESHRRNVLKKLDLKNTAELINYVYRENIVE